MREKQKDLYSLISMDSPDAVLDEVCVILKLMAPDFDSDAVISAFHTIQNLYGGEIPGYQACNTGYHDFPHTTDVFLATARLIHGAHLGGLSFSQRSIVLTLIAALVHDTGYIQKVEDKEGTGAKYTADHVQRSIDFLEEYSPILEMTKEEVVAATAMILYTDLAVDTSSIPVPSTETESLGKILGVADLLAQRADRKYPEKLRLLFQEFKEGGVGNFAEERDLLKDSISFCDFVKHRFETKLGSYDRFMASHFKSRWDIHDDLYQQAMEKNVEEIRKMLEQEN